MTLLRFSSRVAVVSPSGGLLGRRLHGLHFELDLDALAHQHTAGLERLVPREPEVLALDGRLGDEPDALVAPRILGLAAVFDVERDLPRHVADGELAADAVAVVPDLF